jgi:hypothetical protein
VLDTLIKFKNEQDMSLTFHKSCGEGVDAPWTSRATTGSPASPRSSRRRGEHPWSLRSNKSPLYKSVDPSLNRKDLPQHDKKEIPKSKANHMSASSAPAAPHRARPNGGIPSSILALPRCSMPIGIPLLSILCLCAGSVWLLNDAIC